jgi:hypothetical protein
MTFQMSPLRGPFDIKVTTTNYATLEGFYHENIYVGKKNNF